MDDQLTAARSGDPAAFELLVSGYRNELYAHCYRMLGSIQDAEDAFQDSLLGAWRGLPTFEARSSVRTWLYRITTHACLRLLERRPTRLLSTDYGPPRRGGDDLGRPVLGPVWLEPLPDEIPDGEVAGTDPAAHYLRREGVELAFAAALQQLPGNQRAVLILRDVLAFSAVETAELLDTSVASVTSALQRARRSIAGRVPPTTQREELDSLGADGRRDLVNALVSAWERADIPALIELLTADATFTMPPLPAWFDGRDAIAEFMAERLFATPWRLLPILANQQLAFGCYQGNALGDHFRLGAVNVLSLRSGRVSWIAAFVDPAVVASFGLPQELTS
ncbi:MAG: RNA polymerase subunit sigma-70 [Propionibacteriaceae bacterium]